MKVTLTRWLSLGSYLGLIAFGMAWAISLGEFKPSQVSFMLVVMVLPLLFPLLGILHGRDVGRHEHFHAIDVTELAVHQGRTRAFERLFRETSDTQHRVTGNRRNLPGL